MHLTPPQTINIKQKQKKKTIKISEKTQWWIIKQLHIWVGSWIEKVAYFANHWVFKPPQNQLVRVKYAYLQLNFQNTFPLHLIHSSMVWYFQKQF